MIQKNKRQKVWGKSALITVLLMSCVFCVTIAQGQTKKKSKTGKKPASVFVPQPVGTLQPEIVSRAEDEQNYQTQPTGEQPQVVENNNKQPETLEEKIDKLTELIKKLGTKLNATEAQQKNDPDAKQKRLLMNLDILNKAEQRAETLRKQLFEMIEKENALKKRLDESDYNSRPEVIERETNLIGSLRPEELREARRKTLETEKTNTGALLRQIQETKINLEDSIVKADQLVEKIRLKLEKEIEDALLDQENKK